MSLALSGRSILGIAIAAIGVLTMAWGTTQAAQDFEGFKTLELGGMIALATGMCLVSEVPTALQIGGIWVAAAAAPGRTVHRTQATPSLSVTNTSVAPPGMPAWGAPRAP